MSCRPRCRREGERSLQTGGQACLVLENWKASHCCTNEAPSSGRKSRQQRILGCGGGTGRSRRRVGVHWAA